MKMSFWTLGWRTLWRDARAGDVQVLMAAVLLAVAALSAVGFFADRLEGGLRRDARQLLGGDVVLVSDQPPPAAWRERAQGAGLRTAQALTFPTMARADEAQGGAARLVMLKAVEGSYPLRGQVRLALDAADKEGQPATGAPAAGTAWMDAALGRALHLNLGDEVLLGKARLRITHWIAQEPDRGGGMAAFAPRVLIGMDDLAATALVQPASRVLWRLAVASEDDAALRAFQDWAKGAMQGVRGARLESLESGRPEMQQTLERASLFLRLVALLAALLAAVAVALAARSFAARRLDDCAMLRVLGVPQRTMAAAYALEFFLAALLASALGVLLGLLAHSAFVRLLASAMPSVTLPAPGAWPALLGVGAGLALLLAFGLPPVLRLARVPPLRVLRRDALPPPPAAWLTAAAGAAGFAALLAGVSSNLRLALIVVGGFAAALLLFALAAWCAVRTLRRTAPARPRALLLAVRQMAARPGPLMLQTSALAAGLLALALLVLLRTDLIASWRSATPPDAPNRFVINLMPEQADDFLNMLHAAGVQKQGMDFSPMFRGRLTHINGKPAALPEKTSREERSRAQRLLEREFNLSHMADMPAHNQLAAGLWKKDEENALSVEEGLAKTLGLKLGDELLFDIAGLEAKGRITSLRRVDWASMHVNFFVIFPRAEMPDGDSLPVTHIAAWHAPENHPDFDNDLAAQFPNITLIDTSAIIAQVQRVLNQVIRAVEFLFLFTLAAGLLVLLAAIGAQREGRAFELAVMRALGASERLLAGVQRAELLGMGALAGLLAGCAALLCGWALARWVFEFEWSAPLATPIISAAAGALLAWAAGWPSLRALLRRPVVHTLRQAVQE